MRRPLVQMERPVQKMDVGAEPPFKLPVKFIYNLEQGFRRDGFLHRPNLVNAFLRAGLVVREQIPHAAVALRVPCLFIPCVLGFHVIRIMLHVISSLYLLKAEIRLGGILPAPGGGIAPVTVPVHVFLCPLRINMAAVIQVKAAVIVAWVVRAVFAGASVVPCQFQCQILLPFSRFPGWREGCGAAEPAELASGNIPSTS